MERCLACEAVVSSLVGRGSRKTARCTRAGRQTPLTQRVTPINALSRGPAILHGSARLSAPGTTLIVSAGFPGVTGSLSGASPHQVSKPTGLASEGYAPLFRPNGFETNKSV